MLVHRIPEEWELPMPLPDAHYATGPRGNRLGLPRMANAAARREASFAQKEPARLLGLSG